MSIDSEADLAGLRRAGSVAAPVLEAMKARGSPEIVTRAA